MTREEAAKIICESFGCDYHYCLTSQYAEAFDMAIAALRRSEIIRCEGCRYYADGHCDMHHMATDPDDFCSYAVRR